MTRNVQWYALTSATKNFVKRRGGTLPAGIGQVEKQDYEYERNHTANMFMTVEPLIGKRRVRVHRSTNQAGFC